MEAWFIALEYLAQGSSFAISRLVAVEYFWRLKLFCIVIFVNMPFDTAPVFGLVLLCFSLSTLLVLPVVCGGL